MQLGQALAAAAEFAEPSSFEQLGRHLDPAWIEQALRATGTVTIRRRRLPAEQVVWLVIGMGLYRAESIERVVDLLDIALPDRDDTTVTKGGVSQARQRLPEAPLAYLFETTATEWATRSADAHRWRVLFHDQCRGCHLKIKTETLNLATCKVCHPGGLKADAIHGRYDAR